MTAPALPIEYKGDHVERVSRYTDLWRNKEFITAITKIFLEQVQDLEDAFFDIIYGRMLDLAVGVQLDIIGEIVRQPRTTPDDDRYRTIIRVRIAINRCSGTTPELINILSLLLRTERFTLHDEPPHQLRIVLSDYLESVEADLLYQLMNTAKMGGVRLLIQFSYSRTSPQKLLLANSDSGTWKGGTLENAESPPVSTPGTLDSVV